MAFRRFPWSFTLCVLGAMPGIALAGPGAQPPAPAPATPAAAPAEKPAAPPEFSLTADADGKQFTFSAKNVDVKTVLQALTKESGWAIRVEPETARKVTLQVDSETFERALITLARAINYTPSRLYVITPQKEGQELPDHFKLPLENIATVSLKLTEPTPAAGVITALKTVARVEIEASPALKGEAKIEADATPLPEVLDTFCRQIGAVWTLAYRLKPAPKQAGAAAGDPADPAELQAQQEMEQWSKMTPQQRRQFAQQQMGNMLRADPAQRKQEVRALTSQLNNLSRGLGKLSGEDRKKLTQSLLNRAGPYMEQYRQLTPEQQRDFEPAMRAFQRLMGIAQQPPQTPKAPLPQKR